MGGLILGSILTLLVVVGSVYAVVRARRALRSDSAPARDQALQALLAAARRRKAAGSDSSSQET